MKSFLITSLLFAFATGTTAAMAQGNPQSSLPHGYPSVWLEEKRPTLLIKSKDYLVHDFRTHTRKDFSVNDRDGFPITYTSCHTGQVHTLYVSGNIPKTTVAGGVEKRRILGIAFNKRNIFFCVWQTDSHLDRSALGEASTQRAGGGFISLLIFRANDGQFVQELPVLPDGDMSKFVAQENLDTGPLRVEKNAIICFDQVFKFNKGQIIPPKVLAPKNPPTASGPFMGFGQPPGGGFGF